MITLIRQEFIVDVPLEVAWQHLARVERWPNWAMHIERIELVPPGELTPKSSGTIYLKNGVKSMFQMTEFNPQQNWKWAGAFLWLTIHYDHRFEAIDDRYTQMIFVVDGEGVGVSIFGRLFAAIYM